MFDAFYERHSHRLREFLRRRVASDEVDDVLGETFVAAWRNFDWLRAEPSREIAWLLVTARNLLLNHLRAATRSSRLKERLESIAQAGDVVPADPVSRDDFITDASVAEVFAQLSDDDRLVLTLDVWDDCTPEEMSAVLGCSRSAAKTRLSRARARLRHRLEQSSQQQSIGGDVAGPRRD